MERQQWIGTEKRGKLWMGGDMAVLDSNGKAQKG